MSLPPASSSALDEHDRKLLDALPDQGPLVAAVEEPTEAPAPAPAPAAATPAPAPAADTPAPSPAPSPAPAPAPTTAPAPAPTPAPTAAPAATPAPAPAASTEQHAGNLRNALRASRQAERRATQERDALAKQLEEERAKNGQTTGTDADDYTEEQLAELKENYPDQFRTVMRVRELEKTVQELRKTAAPAPQPGEWVPTTYEPAIQDVIDQVPTLMNWQYSKDDQEKFDLAAQYDTALRADPDWKDKPPVERFQEAVKRTQSKLGLPVDGTAAPAPAPAPAQRQDPAAVIANAPVAPPAGISDFRGGATADAPAVDFHKLPDAAIYAALDRVAGSR